ncbi:hypothetical protein HDV02_000681 [Globomyces sp. JEL0801]|nr:hypothetical protein HDV02_000681 [Globomyces sp. JEL0801]
MAPQFTLRVAIIGTLWVAFLSCSSGVLSFRATPVYIPATFATLFAYPMGVFLATILPKKKILSINLNPGPFHFKEHVLIYVMASCATGIPYGVDNVVAIRFKKFFGDSSVTFWNSLPWVLASQLVGYGIAGLFKRVLVKPKSMLWPKVLSQIAIFQAFNGFQTGADINSSFKLSRFTLFWIGFIFMFLYSFLPSYFASSLYAVSLLCLITKNKTWSLLGSTSPNTGVGLGSLTFAWDLANGFIYTPWHVIINWVVGIVFFHYIVTPYFAFINPLGAPELLPKYRYGNIPTYTESQWLNASIPKLDYVQNINTATLFSKHGIPLQVARGHLLSADNSLNQTVYDANQPIYLSPMYTMYYLGSFFNITAVLTHFLVWYGSDILSKLKRAIWDSTEPDLDLDIHNELMLAYPEIPESFYLLFWCVLTLIAVLVCEWTPFQMPWWLTILAIFIGTLFTIPVGIIQAITGVQPGLNILCQLIPGLILPGNTIAVMCFKSLGHTMMVQALTLLSDLKLGHYMHINPIHMFTAQFVATVLASIFNNASVFYTMDHLTDLLDTDPQWNANEYQVFTNAAGIWGAIGPIRFWGPSSPLFPITSAILLGIFIPLIPYLLSKRFPSPTWSKINTVVIAYAGFHPSPGAFQVSFLTPLFLGYLGQHYLYRTHPRWWRKFYFVLMTAFDTGNAVALLAVSIFTFLGINLPSKSIYNTNVDYYCRNQTWDYV